MNRTSWRFKDELSHTLQQWHILLGLFLLGSFAGWLAADLVPASYQVSTPLYIGLETYRAYSDPAFSAYANQEYSNQDDYKNWQMSQLNELILAKDFLDETLASLQSQDPGWKEVNLIELRGMLSAEWRTAGRWNLIARHPQRDKAEQALLAWQEVVLAKTQHAILKAQEMIKVDIQLQAIRDRESQAKARYLRLQTVINQIQKYSEQLSQLPQEKPLSPDMRWQVLALPSLAADFTPAWIFLLNKVPNESAKPAEYLDWLAECEILSKEEGRDLLEQREVFNRQFKVEYEKYLAALRESRGLSPNLIIEKTDPRNEIQVIHNRSNAQYAFVGGLLGWIAYLIFRIIAIQGFPASEKRQSISLDETN